MNMNGQDPNGFVLEVRVQLRNNRDYNNRFEVNETLEIGAPDFLGIAAILGEFHNLSEKLRAKADGESLPS